MDPDEQPQQMTGVVIISLPPPDNPSLGKTITAFTIVDPIQPTPSHHAQFSPSSSPAHPMHPTPSSHRTLVSPSSATDTASSPSLGKSRRVLVLAGVAALLLLFIHQSFSYARFELMRSTSDGDERSDDGVRSFLFDLYPKSGGGLRPDLEAKLGSFVAGRGRVRRYRRNGDAVNASATVFSVRGNVYPDGLYYASIPVGNPARPYFLDLDTGSDLTWIQCDAPCTSCAKGPHPFYMPTKEKLVPGEDSLCREVHSNQQLAYCQSCPQCDYQIEYADQSSSMGVLARDELTLMMANGTSLNPKFVFGCAYDQKGQLSVSPANTDGILGLSSAKVSLPYQLASQGIINNVVGHCIRGGANSGGYLFLGDDFVPRWGMNWAPMLGGSIYRDGLNFSLMYENMENEGNYESSEVCLLDRKFYHVEITKVSFGSKQLLVGGGDSNAGRVIFDTGSSYTYFTKGLYTSLITSLKDVSLERLIQDESDSTLPVCWRVNLPLVQLLVTAEDVKKFCSCRSVEDVKEFFKPLTLHFGSRWWFGSKRLVIHPEDISLRGQLVVYDNVKQQIGWVRSDCAKPQNVMSWSFF
ncbi:hypothetical protein ACLOJK_001384 [Asimina triloba]